MSASIASSTCVKRGEGAPLPLPLPLLEAYARTPVTDLMLTRFAACVSLYIGHWGRVLLLLRSAIGLCMFFV